MIYFYVHFIIRLEFLYHMIYDFWRRPKCSILQRFIFIYIEYYLHDTQSAQVPAKEFFDFSTF